MPIDPSQNRILAIAGALAACVLLGACGGSGSGTPSASSTRDENLLKFSKCMREHGIKNFPNPEQHEGQASLHIHPGPGGVEASQQTMEAAQKACQRYAEAAAPKLTPQERVQREEQLQRLAYHIAVRRGCDVDQPRNLAKSVTVE